MRKQIITAMAVVAIVGVSRADVIFDSAFDGNAGATALAGNADNSSGSSTLTINDWTGSATSISDLTAISPASGFATVQGGANPMGNTE